MYGSVLKPKQFSRRLCRVEVLDTFRSVSTLFINWKNLNNAESDLDSTQNKFFWSYKSTFSSAVSARVFSETALNLVDIWRFWIAFFNYFFGILRRTSFSNYFSLSSQLGKKLRHLLSGQSYNNYSKMWDFSYFSSNKTYMVPFLTSIFPFRRMNFEEYFKKL